MTHSEAQQLLDKIIGQVFGYKNPFSIEDFQSKYAFDIRLPYKVQDAEDGSITWVQSKNPKKFLKKSNVIKRSKQDDWLQPKKDLRTIEDIIEAWKEVDFATAEYAVNAHNFGESANIYDSENVFRSLDIDHCKNILFSDGINNSECIAAGQRTTTSTFCIRIEDSAKCGSSFGLSMCENVTKSFFVHDSSNVSDSIFCSHLNGKQFCIANIQFSEEEYKHLKPMILEWILQPEN